MCFRLPDNGPCLGSRKHKQPYDWLSYGEVAARAEALGSALLHRGHSASSDPYIGIFSQNRPEVILYTHTYRYNNNKQQQMYLEITFKNNPR